MNIALNQIIFSNDESYSVVPIRRYGLELYAVCKMIDGGEFQILHMFHGPIAAKQKLYSILYKDLTHG